MCSLINKALYLLHVAFELQSNFLMTHLSRDVWHGLVAKNRSLLETSFIAPPEFPLL